jgi:hypothetical protein
MSIRVSLTLILLIAAITLTHLYDTNQTAKNFVEEYAHKVGINIGNYVTQTPVCPQGYVCQPEK